MQDFYLGEKAIFRGKDGKAWDVVVQSKPKKHDDSPEGEIVRELQFLDSPEGPGVFAVNASQLEKVL